MQIKIDFELHKFHENLRNIVELLVKYPLTSHLNLQWA